jgi:hypothetical protein
MKASGFDRIEVAFDNGLVSTIRPFFFTIHRIRLVTSLAAPACFIVNKLSIWRGGKTCKTMKASAFGGACRPLKRERNRNLKREV